MAHYFSGIVSSWLYVYTFLFICVNPQTPYNSTNALNLNNPNTSLFLSGCTNTEITILLIDALNISKYILKISKPLSALLRIQILYFFQLLNTKTAESKSKFSLYDPEAWQDREH